MSRQSTSRVTVGKIASDLLASGSGKSDPREIQRATEKEYIDNLEWCVQHALKKVDCSSVKGHDICKNREALEGDFFVSVLLKKEKILENVLRNYFIATKDCPTPFFDQTMYKYNSKKEAIEFLWVIPDQETCLTYKENAKKVVPSERALLQYILDYYDGTLHRICKTLNGETMAPGSLLI